MKFILSILLIVFLHSNSVYVCRGHNSFRYHKTINCKGLSKCNSDIDTTSIDAATKEGYSPCKLCYKK